jgi:metal-responsive CopG/Arc/MetJ family transcriptional regulator
MKLSVSLGAEDVAALDRFVAQTGLASRSAGVQHAIGLLSDAELVAEYEEAFTEWSESEDAELWEATVADGLDDEAW